ncbi:MAG TPA: response regulator [Candidatus Dormibacteraeota bacterium]|nr:response regulator [Candidatus Dormibacteraeota bacterium]
MRAPSILVVDDNETNLKLLRVVLARSGFSVATAGNAAEARRSIEISKPDVILMDIQLPGIDGLALTRSLKADAANRDIAIIAVTSYAMKGDREKALAAGCDDYLSKPVDIRSIGEVIRSHLKRA